MASQIPTPEAHLRNFAFKLGYSITYVSQLLYELQKERSLFMTKQGRTKVCGAISPTAIESAKELLRKRLELVQGSQKASEEPPEPK